MGAAEAWGQRWVECESSLSRKFMEMAYQKKSLVVLAADRYTMDGLNSLLDEVSDSVVALKTHVDLVEDWSRDSWLEFVQRASGSGMLIFEDRKHGDIGKIARDQMGGVYDIRSWADLVTAHMISGPDILDGLEAAWNGVGREGGVLLLAQMSSAGNLLETPGYSDAVVEAGKKHSGCFGFIGNGSNDDEVRELRLKVGEGKMIWTPGVNISSDGDELGQRYGNPSDAVMAGSDGIIVGSGIHRASDPSGAAKEYARVSWSALLERTG